MKINWDPRFSPFWGWVKNHGIAILAAVVAKPDVFGIDPTTAQHIGGVVTIVGSLLQNYLPNAPKV